MKTKATLIILLVMTLTAMPFVSSGQDQDSVKNKQTDIYLSDITPNSNEISVSAGTVSGFGAVVDVLKIVIEGVGNGITHNKADTKFVGTYGIDYYYQVNKWLRPGAKFIYEGLSTTISDSTGTVVNHYYTSTISFMPSVQFSYLNRKYVKMYSGIDLGLTVLFDNNKQNSNSQPLFGFNITLVGIRVGNDRIYGLLETNIGMDALIKAGFGVRF